MESFLSQSNNTWDECFGTKVDDKSQIPMSRFLQSNFVIIHPLEKCPMCVFFRVFDKWCIDNGYGKQKHQKYGHIWSQFSIKAGRGRLLFGVNVRD